MLQSVLVAYDEQDFVRAERLATQIHNQLPDLDVRRCGVRQPGAGKQSQSFLGATADVDAVICAVGPDTAQDGTLDQLIAGARKIERPLLGVLLDSDPAIDILPVPLAAPEESTIVTWDMDQIIQYIRDDAQLDDPYPGHRIPSRTVIPPG